MSDERRRDGDCPLTPEEARELRRKVEYLCRKIDRWSGAIALLGILSTCGIALLIYMFDNVRIIL